MYARPIKRGGNQNYVDEVSGGFAELPAKELDDDLNVLYDAVNRPKDAPVPAAVFGATPPALPLVGTLWWRTTDGNLYIYYDDGNSLQWVPATSTTASQVSALTSMMAALAARVADLEAK